MAEPLKYSDYNFDVPAKAGSRVKNPDRARVEEKSPSLMMTLAATLADSKVYPKPLEVRSIFF